MKKKRRKKQGRHNLIMSAVEAVDMRIGRGLAVVVVAGVAVAVPSRRLLFRQQLSD